MQLFEVWKNVYIEVISSYYDILSNILLTHFGMFHCNIMLKMRWNNVIKTISTNQTIMLIDRYRLKVTVIKIFKNTL